METTRAPTTARTVLPAMVCRPGDSSGLKRPTRTHSSAASAFPGHTDYACSLTIYRRRLKVDEWVSIAALVCAIVWAVWG